VRGVIKKGDLTPAQEKEYRDKLEEALMAGYRALQAGKTSVDAVEIAIRILKIRRFSTRAKARFSRMTESTNLTPR
jgi:beta-aspartyl-peptidase (threonine type)